MKIIEKTTEFELTEDTAVAIGKFDGFHMGHQKLLHMVTEQKAKGLAARQHLHLCLHRLPFQQRSTAGADHDSGEKEYF